MVDVCNCLEDLNCKNCIFSFTKDGSQFQCHSIEDHDSWRFVKFNCYCGEGQWPCHMPYGDVEILNRPEACQVFYKVLYMEQGLVNPEIALQRLGQEDEEEYDDSLEIVEARFDELDKKIDTITQLLIAKFDD